MVRHGGQRRVTEEAPESSFGNGLRGVVVDCDLVGSVEGELFDREACGLQGHFENVCRGRAVREARPLWGADSGA